MPVSPDKFWICIGDLHGSVREIQSIPGVNESAGIIISGDITNAGGRETAGRIIQEISNINANIYAQIGNMDSPGVLDFLEEKGFSIHAKGTQLDKDVGLIGVGYSIPTPFGTPSEVTDDVLGTWLNSAWEQVSHLKCLILVSHTPPYQSVVDCVDRGKHVGSKAVRSFIERIQPDVCISGHIHESVGEGQIGKTKIINPGMFARGGYVVLTRNNGRVEASMRQVGV